MKTITVTCLGVLVFLPSFGGYAQIKTDTSLGRSAQTLSGPNFLIPQTLGKLSGNNLFHSFETFNILSGQSANFTTDTAGINNVISRVTGGSLSQINGKLSMTPVSGTPSFFFINPAGVTFGAGASIDVPGAFHVSTANYLKFADGNFDADTAQASTFSSAAPEAFGFLGTTRAGILIKDGVVLLAKPSHPFSIVAGDISIDYGMGATQGGGEIRVAANGQKSQDIRLTGALPTTDGNLSLLRKGGIRSITNSAADGGLIRVSAGAITLDGKGGGNAIASYTNTGSTGKAGSIDVTATGTLSIQNTGSIYSTTSTLGDAGSIHVNSGNITIDNTYGIYTYTNGAGNSGNVDIFATDTLSLRNGGEISATAYSSGNARSINVNAGNTTIDNTSCIYTFTNGTGNAGNIGITATGALSVLNGGQIFSSTFSSGDAGTVKVNAGTILIDRQGSNDVTGIIDKARTGSTGKAANIEVTATSTLSVLNGGVISSSTFSSGDAGTVKVTADAIQIDGKGSNVVTGIMDEAQSGTGKAGNIEVTAFDTLSMVNGGQISSSTFSSGDAGTVKVNAGTILIDRQGSNHVTGIIDQANGGSTGNAGHIEVTATGTLSVLNGGVISPSTFSSGDAGMVKISADTIVIDGQGGSKNTGIYDQAYDGSTGKAGDIEVKATGTLSVLNGGIISSSTYSSGDAGTVKVNAGTILIDRQGGNHATGIIDHADGGSTGNAGNIEVTATGKLSVLNGGFISSSTYSSGDAGAVKVNADAIEIDGRGSNYVTGIIDQAEPSSTGNAGNIEVTATTGTLSVQNGGVISSSTFSSGDAGTVKVTADAIQIDGKGNNHVTGIIDEAQSGTGKAGNIDVTAIGTLSIVNGGQISSSTLSSGDAGMVKVNADTIVIDRQGSKDVTGIIDQAINGSNGKAGDIEVTATGTIWVQNGGIISSSTFSSGDAGSVKVNAGTIVIDGQGQRSNDVTGITDQANAGTGKAGNIEVTATGTLSVQNGGVISSSTFSSGDAGTVNVSAATLLVDGDSTSIKAKASSGSFGQTGNVIVLATDQMTISNGGSVSIQNDATATNAANLTPTLLTVTAPTITLKDATITSASTGNVSASNIQVIATERLSIDPSSITTSANLGNGGAITIQGGKVMTLDNSQITTSVKGLTGDGGDITISANTLFMNLRYAHIFYSHGGMPSGGDESKASESVVHRDGAGFALAGVALPAAHTCDHPRCPS
jgi:filamentous hemagglutinin family protein